MRKLNWRKWCDEWILMSKGILLATKEPKFWIGFVVAFVFFGTLMNLLAGGTSKFQLMWALGMPRSLEIIWSAIIGVFGVNMPFMEWLPVFALALLQGILIGLIVLLWNKKRTESAANVEKAGIITGLIALGAGCPTCGTTLLTPLIGAIFSTGSLAIAGALSMIVTIVAVIVALLSLKRIGVETYVIMVNEKYLAKKKVERDNGNSRTKSEKANGR
ncbi:hypothetical protein IKG68_02340 [Candidatus Saccharibacteria bacterium]|nr:hypothetical protein [Candidatus Saccharibacteria bacterium]